MPYKLAITLAIAAVIFVSCIVSGYKRDIATPSIAVIYIAVMGLGYMIGYGVNVLKVLFFN